MTSIIKQQQILWTQHYQSTGSCPVWLDMNDWMFLNKRANFQGRYCKELWPSRPWECPWLFSVTWPIADQLCKRLSRIFYISNNVLSTLKVVQQDGLIGRKLTLGLFKKIGRTRPPFSYFCTFHITNNIFIPFVVKAFLYLGFENCTNLRPIRW